MQPSLFTSIDLARRIEHAERAMMSSAATAIVARGQVPGAFCEAISGAKAIWAGSNSPLNKIVALGFDGPVNLDRLAEIESLYANCASPVHVELSTLAHPSVAADLTSHGYRLEGFEDVLGRALDPGQPTQDSVNNDTPESAATTNNADISVRPSPDSETELWIETLAAGFDHPDTDGIPAQEEIPREAMEAALRDMTTGPEAKRYLAELDGAVAGAGSIRIHQDVAIFSGAATLPQYRRRGVQTALLENRLEAARDLGCDLAVVTTLPGSKSQHNVIRRGFEHLYTRAILVKHTSRCT